MKMKVKIVHINIQSEKDFEEKVKAHLSKIDRGVFPAKAVREISFTTLSAMRKSLTQKRLEVMHCIKHNHPKSIYELAGLLKRDIKNVRKDIQLLEQLDFIEVRKGKSKDSERQVAVPQVNFERINVDIAV